MGNEEFSQEQKRKKARIEEKRDDENENSIVDVINEREENKSESESEKEKNKDEIEWKEKIQEAMNEIECSGKVQVDNNWKDYVMWITKAPVFGKYTKEQQLIIAHNLTNLASQVIDNVIQ